MQLQQTQVMQEEVVSELIQKYLDGKASSEEIDRLNLWYKQFDSRPSYTGTLSGEQLHTISSKMFSAILNAIDNNTVKGFEDLADRSNKTSHQAT